MSRRRCRNKLKLRSKEKRNRNSKKRGLHIITNSKKYKKLSITKYPLMKMIELEYIFGGNLIKIKTN